MNTWCWTVPYPLRYPASWDNPWMSMKGPEARSSGNPTTVKASFGFQVLLTWWPLTASTARIKTSPTASSNYWRLPAAKIPSSSPNGESTQWRLILNLTVIGAWAAVLHLFGAWHNGLKSIHIYCSLILLEVPVMTLHALMPTGLSFTSSLKTSCTSMVQTLTHPSKRISISCTWAASKTAGTR